MGKHVLSKSKILEIAKGFYERDCDKAWLKRVHQMSDTTLREKMKDYEIKTKRITVVIE